MKFYNLGDQSFKAGFTIFIYCGFWSHLDSYKNKLVIYVRKLSELTMINANSHFGTF